MAEKPEQDLSVRTKEAQHERNGFVVGPVTNNHGDLPLLVCCFATGLIDASTFSNYSVFVSMQTGNTVILGLSTSSLPANPYAWLTTLVSLGSFLTGAFLTFRISKLIAPKGATTNRLWISLLFFIQGLFVVISASLATPDGLIPQNPAGTSGPVQDHEEILQNVLIVATIPALSFQSGMQIATSRLLGYNELPVNVLTSTYCDLMGDYNLFALNNVKRNRRFAAAVLVLTGSIVSGWILRSSAGFKGVLWLAAGIKLAIGVAMFVFLPRKIDEGVVGVA